MLSHLQGPWVLCCIELVAVMLLYVLGTSPMHLRHPHFSFVHNVEDIVGLSVVRATILSISYGWGVHNVQRCVHPSSSARMHPCSLKGAAA